MTKKSASAHPHVMIFIIIMPLLPICITYVHKSINLLSVIMHKKSEINALCMDICVVNLFSLRMNEYYAKQ